MGLETALILGAVAVAGAGVGMMMSKKGGGGGALPAPPAAAPTSAPINQLDDASKSSISSQNNQMALMRGLASTWNNQSMMTSKSGFANSSTPKGSTFG
jgi:hypothetical protein